MSGFTQGGSARSGHDDYPIVEYSEGLGARIHELSPPNCDWGMSDDTGSRKAMWQRRNVIHALNESGHNCTEVDLHEVISWVRQNRPELLDENIGFPELPEVDPDLMGEGVNEHSREIFEGYNQLVESGRYRELADTYCHEGLHYELALTTEDPTQMVTEVPYESDRDILESSDYDTADHIEEGLREHYSLSYHPHRQHSEEFVVRACICSHQAESMPYVIYGVGDQLLYGMTNDAVLKLAHHIVGEINQGSEGC